MQYRKAFTNIFTNLLAVKQNKNYLNAFPHFLTMLLSGFVLIVVVLSLESEDNSMENG